MADQKKRIKGRQNSSPVSKLIRFCTIPFVIIILIVVILKIDNSGADEEDTLSELPVISLAAGVTQDPNATGENGGLDTGDAENNNTEASEEEIEENQGSENADPTSVDGGAEDSASDQLSAMADPSQYPLQQDALLELTGLVQSYCEAKEECDPDLLAWVFDIGDWSEEQKNEERSRMELVKASIKSYENISCYTIQGPEEDSYVIFPYYEIRYRETETLMPAFSWGYAKKNADGRFYLAQETSDAVNDYIRKAGEKPELKAVMAQILAKQQEAIASDEVLQKIYGGFSESEVIIGGAAQ